ncbi:MAG TPA: CbiX/SirB N-terminal domain-containing protein [Pirellulaceae bacterium]|nr:CbiX/SirB N-terminal domain-containing protein [Pirellulaceae bacterium]
MTNDQVLPGRWGMLLVGHGTRDAQGAAEFLETARLIAALVPSVAVEPGFLELAEPPIDKAFERLGERDVCEIIVVPLLLFAAGHAKQDIPREVSIAAIRFPRLKIRHAEPLGCQEMIVAASAERFRSVLAASVLAHTSDLAASDCDPTTDVAWLLVSRGTSDLSAIAEVRRFARLRRKATPVASARIAFMAVAEPSVAAELEALACSSYSCIVVQPHLLFHGKLTSDLRALVRKMQAECPAKKWLIADHLGPCELIAKAAVQRFFETQASSDQQRPAIVPLPIVHE